MGVGGLDMVRVRVHCFTTSIDGFSAGPDQSVTNPLGVGAATIRQYLMARLVDEMHVAVAPILLGSGESLLAGLDLPALGYRCTGHAASDKAMHYVITRAAARSEL